jgi:hypothetical protein
MESSNCSRAHGCKSRPAGAADWQIIQADGFTDIDARYTLETDSGQLIYVSNVGIRHASPEVMKQLNAGEVVNPALIYFRAVPKFETGAPEWQCLMRSMFIATGERMLRFVTLVC